MPIDFKGLLEQTMTNKERPAYLIVGSRAFAGDPQNPDPRLVQLIWDYVDTLPSNAHVFSGGAQGPDSWAIEAAEHFKLETRVFPARWTRADGSVDRGAGFRRNEQMSYHLASWPGSKHCTAFWNGQSRGTKHTIDHVTELGWCVPLVVLPVGS